MELNKTPLTYLQASELLGVSSETIKKAVLRKVFTRLPREGLYQHLMAGQVELFKGKMLSLSVLNESERKLWQAYADSVYQPEAETRQTPQNVQAKLAELLLQPDVQQAFSMARGVKDTVNSISESEVPQKYPFIQSNYNYERYSNVTATSAIAACLALLLAGKKGSSTSDVMSGLILAILAVLGLLWVLHETNKQKRDLAIDQTIPNPGDRSLVKTLLDNDDTFEHLRSLIA